MMRTHKVNFLNSHIDKFVSTSNFISRVKIPVDIIHSKNDNFIGMGHVSFIEEDKTIFFHAWRADENNIVWNTVYPIVAKYRLEGDEFIFE